MLSAWRWFSWITGVYAAGRSFRKGCRSARCVRKESGMDLLNGRAGGNPALRIFGGGCMISAWWLIPAVMIGAFIGIALLAICSANSPKRDGKKWWEDE